MRKPNEFDTMKVLHYLWSKGALSTTQVQLCLQEGHGLELTELSNEYIKAETPNGKTNYSNKK